MKVKEDFFDRGSFKVSNGKSTHFWEDTWLGDKPLAQQYPSLFSIVKRKQVMVASMLGHNPLNIAFHRSLTGNKWDRWLHLVNRLMAVTLSSEQDKFVWSLTTSGAFTVKSMYLDYMNGHTKYFKKFIWKTKLPLKIKIFMWFFHTKVILTKDNLLKRNWNDNTSYCFCECPLAKIIWRLVHMTFGLSPPKNVKNLFGNWLVGIDKRDVKLIRVGVCAIIWAIWNARNDHVFNRPRAPSFLQVIPMASYWICMWSYLQPVEFQEAMTSRCNRLETIARDLFNHSPLPGAPIVEGFRIARTRGTTRRTQRFERRGLYA
jgi:hypothetical protein